MAQNQKATISSDSGPEIGSILLDIPCYKKFIEDQEHPYGATTTSALLFISMHCMHCIDLLPSIERMKKNHPKVSFCLYSTGDEVDNQSMIDYFEWNFPVYSLDTSGMEDFFKVTYLPFVVIADNRGSVMAKGVIYNDQDFEQLISNVHSA